MAVVIDSFGSNAAVDDALFGGVTRQAKQYLTDRFNQVSDYVTQTGGEVFGAISNFIGNHRQHLATDHMVDAVRAQMGSFFDPNRIGYLQSLDQVQGANVMMQQHLISHESVRPMVENGLLNGYGLELSEEAKDNFHHQHSNGMIREDKEGRMYCTSYVLEEDQLLSFHDRVNIDLSVSKLMEYVNDNIDPTSLEGDSVLD